MSAQADWYDMPADLPVPVDDGLADHLRGFVVPDEITLLSTDLQPINLAEISKAAPVLVFIYPRTGKPGVPNPDGWDAIPGARGCTPVRTRLPRVTFSQLMLSQLAASLLRQRLHRPLTVKVPQSPYIRTQHSIERIPGRSGDKASPSIPYLE